MPATTTPPVALPRDQPWTWRLSDVLGSLSDRQRRYVELLPRLFNVKTAAGRVIPYDLQPYQAWWHAHSPLALGKDAPPRLAEKGRGLGLTLMSAMDALLLAHTKPRITIPVAGRAGDTSDEFIEKTWDLLNDCKIPGFFDPNTGVTRTIELGNGSRVLPMPGGSPNKVRSKRIIHGVLDEFAFHEYPDQLWKAIRGSQTEGGTLDVISTHHGSDTFYYRLVDDSQQGRNSFQHFYFPAHDPKAWRQDVSIKEQIEAGKLRLIAPWLSVRVLDQLRLEDPAGYAQEILCDVMDASLNLLSRAVVERQQDPTIPDWGKTPDLGEVPDHVARQAFTVPRRPHGDIDPVIVGVDFARDGDLAAYTAWAATNDGPRQRWLEVLRATDTPDQNHALRAIVAAAKPTDVFIDMTGNGTGLYDYAKKELPCEVHGVHFAAGVHLGGAKKTPIKKAIALNLARYLQDGDARLLGVHKHADLQRRHLLSVRRADLDAPSGVEGHADILWANALALWGIRHLDRTPLGVEHPPVDVAGILTDASF